MNLSTKQKQTHRHREQTCGCQGVGVVGRDGQGFGDYQMQAIIYRMDKQQGPTAQHWELYSIYVINHNGKEYEKECIYI